VTSRPLRCSGFVPEPKAWSSFADESFGSIPFRRDHPRTLQYTPPRRAGRTTKSRRAAVFILARAAVLPFEHLDRRRAGAHAERFLQAKRSLNNSAASQMSSWLGRALDRLVRKIPQIWRQLAAAGLSSSLIAARHQLGRLIESFTSLRASGFC